jgi:hypothetical protein
MRTRHPTRREVLQGAAAGLTLSLSGLTRAAADSGCHLIVVTALGGWDVTYCIDPKQGSKQVDGPAIDEDPDEPEDREAVSTLHGLTLQTNGFKRPALTAFFERWGQRTSVVNGLWIGSLSHSECQVRTLTGALSETRPDVAALVADGLGRDRPIPYMDLGGAGYAGELAALTGRTGATNQLKQLLDRTTVLQGPVGSGIRYPLFTAGASEDGLTQTWLEQQRARLSPTAHVARHEAYAEALGRAQALRDQGADFAAGLSQGTVRSLSSQVQLALELLQTGLAHTLSIDSGMNWDTHTDNHAQHALLQQLFTGLDALAEGLSTRGLLDRTVVAVLSEMTRTPRRNAEQGKDHWPVTSALLFGGPIANGTLGGTDAGLDALPVDLVTGRPNPAGVVPRYDHFAAGLLAALEVDPARWFPGVTPLGGLTG